MTFDPVDLAAVPAVDALLGSLGLGTFRRDTLLSPFGRNDIWAGPTTTGRGVFVKQLVGRGREVAGRLDRLLSFEKTKQHNGTAVLPGVTTPRFLGCDRENRLVAFDLVDRARSGSELMVDEEFDDAHSARVGTAIAALHNLGTGGDLDRSRPALPSLPLLDGVPLEVFENLSFGEIEAWRLQQNDPALVAALHALADAETRAPVTPAHCDLRLDQLLVDGEQLWITDWEEFRLADPARDIGSFSGEWLYRAVLDIVTTRGDFTFVAASFDHDMVLQRGASRIQALRPRIKAFWSAYRAGRPDHDPGLAVRAASFAGWHMLDRLIAGSTSQGRLSGIERAAAGIGRSILLQPARFADTIGLETQR